MSLFATDVHEAWTGEACSVGIPELIDMFKSLRWPLSFNLEWETAF